MKTDQHKRKYLKDYRPPDFGISETRLEFHLDAGATLVKSRLQLRRMTTDSNAPLVLDGIELSLVEISLDGRILQP
ncbi:MAG: hypothetical protein OER87_20460, partial [Gammaproteobacteria bacterium]|nr:hypothetical protein [Gammaproteobacteria bacterium]